ncbi:cytokine receptor common subunit beta [Spheniscus humboldti]
MQKPNWSKLSERSNRVLLGITRSLSICVGVSWSIGSLQFRKRNRESIPRQTLQCYNDYISLTTCTWMECSEAHQFLNVTLNFNTSREKTKEMTCRFHKGENHADCQNFTMHWVCHRHGYDQRTYNFKFDLTLHAELEVYLFQNVQTLPPQNLSVSLMTSGDFLLTWKAADGSQGLGNALEYEVTYKMEWESWEKAASLLLSNTTRCHLSHEDLVPGSSYVARVRARRGQASGFSGPYSEWSTEVSWETPEGGLQPRNLRCLFNGADRLTCSWEVKKAIITSVVFGLFFRATRASAEEECSPVHEKALTHIPYVVQSCEIPVGNSSSQSQYHVSVRAKMEEKVIEAYKNIKVLPPANVSVTVTENHEYELRWIKHTFQYGFIKQRYQVEYWKKNQYEKTLQKLNISNDEPPFIFTLQMLASSTEYTGKMRARVNTPLDYEGPWSEWSEEFSWKTENVLPPVVLPVMLPVLIIALLIVAYCSYKYFLRKKQMWEEKIPNPRKSLLIQSYLGMELTFLCSWSGCCLTLYYATFYSFCMITSLYTPLQSLEVDFILQCCQSQTDRVHAIFATVFYLLLKLNDFHIISGSPQCKSVMHDSREEWPLQRSLQLQQPLTPMLHKDRSGIDNVEVKE